MGNWQAATTLYSHALWTAARLAGRKIGSARLPLSAPCFSTAAQNRAEPVLATLMLVSGWCRLQPLKRGGLQVAVQLALDGSALEVARTEIRSSRDLPDARVGALRTIYPRRPSDWWRARRRIGRKEDVGLRAGGRNAARASRPLWSVILISGVRLTKKGRSSYSASPPSVTRLVDMAVFPVWMGCRGKARRPRLVSAAPGRGAQTVLNAPCALPVRPRSMIRTGKGRVSHHARNPRNRAGLDAERGAV